jgi:hypothetical protein
LSGVSRTAFTNYQHNVQTEVVQIVFVMILKVCLKAVFPKIKYLFQKDGSITFQEITTWCGADKKLVISTGYRKAKSLNLLVPTEF